jgi:tetratricopeptide (TPR) repeat protein
VLALDNLETPWTAEPLEVEELLGRLVGVPGVALVVTMRGTARPGGVRWAETVAVSPLVLADARRMFVQVAGAEFAADPDLDWLLVEVDGVPLAVELLAYAAQGQPDLAELRQRWQQERVGLLERMGGGRRELSVPVSVELSLKDPRMTPEGRRLVALLGQLPDGIAHDDLNWLLPEVGLRAAATLRQVGLAFDEAGRLRMLAPIREHAASAYPPEPADLERAVGYYCQLASTVGWRVGGEGGAEAAEQILGETSNLTSMLDRAIAGQRLSDVVDAMVGLIEYMRFTGNTLPGLLVAARAAVDAAGDATQRARLYQSLGDLALDRSDDDAARARYEEALPLYRRVGDVLGEANCIQRLGDIALNRSDYDAARARYEKAVPLYRRVGDVVGEDYCVFSLGDIALERDDYDAARARYEEAVPLFRRVGDVLGEANCIQRLGEIALDRSDDDAARARYEEAVPLYRRVGDVRGEAGCIMGLGDIALAREEYDAARARYEEALALYRRVANMGGEAGCIMGLGDIALARDEYDTARARYEEALTLYERIQDHYSIGLAHSRLADLTSPGLKRDQHLAAAREAWASINRTDLTKIIDQQVAGDEDV